MKYNEDSLTTDAVFKIFFHKRKDYLVLVINEVLKLNVKEEDITFTNNEVMGDNYQDKGSVLDVKVKLESGETVFVEMQNTNNEDILKRAAYYNSKLINEQLTKGTSYDNLKKVYGIFFVNYTIKGMNKMYTKLTMCDIIGMKEVMYPLENHIINLRMIKENKEFSEKMMSFLRYMALMDEKGRMKMTKKDKVAKEVHEEVKDITSSEAYRDYLFTKEKDELDRLYEMNMAKKKLREEIHASAHAEGLAEGLAEGVEQGIETNIKTMYENKLSIEDISKYTNIDIEEVRKIINTK